MDSENVEASNYRGKEIRTVNIKILNNVWSLGARKDLDIFEECLYFNDIRVRQGLFAKEFSTEKKPVFIKTTKFGTNIGIYTGLIPRIRDYLHEHGNKINIETRPNYPEITEPFLPATKFPDGREFKNFREDQLLHINKALQHKRGIIQGFTGMGKSILTMGLMSCFPSAKILFLAHTTGLISQLADDLSAFGITDFTCLYGTKKFNPKARIWLSTRQSILNTNPTADEFDVVLVDECHHVSDFTGQYAEILILLNAPIRLGFTATVPKDFTRKRLAMESFLGPVIAEFSIKEGNELGLLAEPKICIRKIPFSAEIKNIRRYPDVYEQGVKFREEANMMKVNDVAELTEAGQSVLVFVTNIDHGNHLQRLLRERLNSFVPFVKGDITTEIRDNLKESMKNKTIKCIIANVVWREGINIPSLDVMLNASSSKEEIQTLQTVGRALRKTSDKEEVLIVDYFDNSHYFLISHFGERLSTYMNEGWEFMSIKEFLRRRNENQNHQ